MQVWLLSLSLNVDCDVESSHRMLYCIYDHPRILKAMGKKGRKEGKFKERGKTWYDSLPVSVLQYMDGDLALLNYSIFPTHLGQRLNIPPKFPSVRQ